MIPKDQKIDNCAKVEVRGDRLQSPHKHLTPATVDLNIFNGYCLPEAKHAMEE